MQLEHTIAALIGISGDQRAEIVLSIGILAMKRCELESSTLLSIFQ